METNPVGNSCAAVRTVSRTDPVLAAGCVVWRRAAADRGTDNMDTLTAEPGVVEVVLVHRPSPHDDWSLPKGKLDAGERASDAAVREVLEETGIGGSLGPKLIDVDYTLPDGRSKQVCWWMLEAATDSGFTPNDEIAEIRWLDADTARDFLSRDSDRLVLAEFRRVLDLRHGS